MPRSPLPSVALAAGLASVCALAGAPASAETRVALVIGNAAYAAAPLRNPVNDATVMATRLKALGFEVILRTNVAQREMTRAVSQFGQSLKPGSVALFYYAGHGMQVRGRNFLVPVDADIQSEASVRSEAVDLDLVLEQLGPSRLSMVILDACRNNPFEGRFRSSGGGGLAQIDAPKGTLLAYATAPGKVASDGEGAHGLYTAELLKAMDLPGAKVEEVFKAVRVNVIKATAGAQVPWESSSLTGDYYFRPAAPPPAHAQARPALDAKQTELQAKLEAERRQREQDAQLLKAEMEKLRQEVQRLTQGAAAPATRPPVVVAAQPAPPRVEAKEPSAKAAAPAPKDAKKPVPAKDAGSARADVAMASVPPAVTRLRESFAKEWARRTAILDGQRGQLGFSKAMAVLFEPYTDDQLLLLLGKERSLRDLPYHSALAFGLGQKGGLSWGRSASERSPATAMETALQRCSQRSRVPCSVVVANGEVGDAALLEWARRVTARDVVELRRDLLRARYDAR